MPFRLPNFNSNISIWHGQSVNGTVPIGGPAGAPDEETLGQVGGPKVYPYWSQNEMRRFSPEGEDGPYYFFQSPYLVRVPKDTDIRGTYHSGGADILEVEGIPGNPYLLCMESYVVASGFINEHIRAVCIRQLGDRPTPPP